MKTKKMSASLLEKILILVVIVIFCATVAVYYFLSSFAKSQAIAANHSMITAQSSQKDIESLQKSYEWIQKNPDAAKKTGQVVADASEYKYQNQVIKDIESFSKQVGLNIKKYTFSESSAGETATGGGASGSASPASGGSDSGAAATATPTTDEAAGGLPAGLVATTIDIGFDEEVSYTNALQFIKKIEQNVTRMQITSLSLAPVEDDPSKVTISMTISIFINKGS